MMERHWLTFYLVLCIFQPLCTSLDQASFYGNSYISIPLKEAKSSTDIHFKFRTRLPSSLLLLVAGSTDYCIVRLDNNRLKVNINLGAGESELLTPRSLILSDFKWHDVFIVRKEANLSIIVDNSHTVRKSLPGKFFELNINNGLFVGGRGNYSDFFFGHHINFRGCLSNVMYNGLYVLDIARRRQSQAVVHGITWNCASEFGADIDRPISFIEDEAFMVIPHPIDHVLKLQVELKTYLPHSIVFYNSGLLSKLDLFAVEVWEGKLKVTLKCGNTVIENTNHVVVADGHWHKMSLRVTPTSIDLNVNSNMSTVKLPRGHVLDFNELFYIGGIEISKRARAMSKGLKTSDGSFKGCVRHLVFGEHKKGLPDVYVSEGLLPGCLWEYPCIHKPCSGSNVCLQQGLDSFKCECQQKDCSNHTKAKVYTKTNLADELELLALEPLEVLEGQNVLITTTNLHVILDYPKYDIKDNGITFITVDGPTYGSIKNVLWNEKNSFTLSDVARDKVYYIHDGSEYHKDHIVLEVEFSTGEHFILPSYLQGRFKFTLYVNVVPVNDPPVLNIPTTSVLRIAKGTRKILDSDLLQVNDPDNTAKQLIYSVVETSLGHFEFVHKPGQPVSSFTQKDIENKQIAFVHRSSSSNDSYITLQVSDGIETSSQAKLRVQTFPQHWRLQNNTGVILMHETSAIITPFNLSFVSNVVNSTDNAEYHIVQGPQFGTVEVERNGGLWENSLSFTSEDVRRHRVRYTHVTSMPDYDEFQFRTSLNVSLLYMFRMTFAKCELKALKNGNLLLNSSQEATLSEDVLEYQTQPVRSPTTSIIYVITRPPMYGFLFSTVSKYRMRYHDTFTQEDIISRNINYRLYRKSYSPVVDGVTFKVMARGCKNITGNLTLSHQPSNETALRVQRVFQRLQVGEGGKTNIGPSHLSIKSDLISDLFFNITTPPQHGWLQVVKNGIVLRNKTNYFTLSELSSNQLFYVHDDSETKYDSFKFMALSREEENFQYVEAFHIDILLKNDNSPVRTVERIFHVVVGGQKLLTKDDLAYLDADLDTLPSDIIYTCRELPNGDVYSAKNASVKLTEFTQEDLNNRAVLFKHKGPEYGKLRLWVTDGQFYVNGILEVQASAPFIRVFTNKKLIVKQGSMAAIQKEHLSYATNLYADDENVVYEVTTKPNSGRIVLGDKSEDVLQFTQAQVNNGEIFYVNELNSASADEVGLRVRCHDAINVAQLRIWMLPPSYWEPLSIKTCQALLVEESTSALLNRAVLEVAQPEVPSSAITYHINEFPEHGYISILPAFKSSDDESTNVRSFTQAILNENRVVYIQSVANQTKDRVVFNVTNGMVWLDDVVLLVQIIPEHLYLGTNVLNVYEGGVVLISSVHLFVVTDYYKSRVTEYILLELPKHGCVQVQKSCVKLRKFTHKELKAGIIHYAHDGSENLKDEIKLTATAGQKRSLPVTLSIVILPINDQKPHIVNNTGLVMWEGGTAVITSSMLAAVDEDRPTEILRYQVLGCWWGNVSLLSDASTSLQFFTQELVNKNLVAFRHLNGSEAKFVFNVTDGLHSTREHTFHIKTKPVALGLISKPLYIFPLQKKYLSSSYMLASVSDPDRVINFEVVVPPSLGRLMMASETPGMFKVISGFTQADLNNSRVFYEHTHPFAGLYANDSFQFNVRSHLAQPLSGQKLSIDISVSSGGLDAYVTIPKVKVNEGGIISIPLNLSGVVSFLESHAGLRLPIMRAFASNPQHGQVFLQNNSNLTTFTQQELESGQVLYQHDHSDSLGDNIYFSLYLLPGYIMLCNITVPVVINPINDQPFKLVTRAPHLVVVQGESRNITKNELCTEDADTPPSELLYDIISGPKEGSIVLLPGGISTSHFTQADIDNNRLVYVHNGSLLTDTFHLRVWDGQFRPDYTAFNVQLLPISLNASVGAPMFLQQGSNVVLLTESQFVIDTNANRKNLRYSIKKPPRHGVVYVKDVLASNFGQGEILNKNVMYMQTDMTTANDSFDVFVGMVSGNTSVGSDVTVTITVQPLMQVGNATAFAGEKNRLTLNILDATPLAKLTSSNPRYSITRKPVYGEMRKIIRSSGDHKNVLNTAVTSFSHEEVQSGLIYFVVDDIEVGWNGIMDRLEFILAASIFQPAVGELKINIRSSLLNEIYSTLAGPNDPAGHEGGIHFASPNMTRDYFLIVSMVAGVVVLGVAVIIVIKCRSFEPEELNKEEQCLQPIPLPRPPDRLMVSSPPLKHSQDGFASPLLTALPQCKVTPLNRNELETQARYPYGVDEHADDWSSCDASDPACPSRNNIMLRRNQYWV